MTIDVSGLNEIRDRLLGHRDDDFGGSAFDSAFFINFIGGNGFDQLNVIGNLSEGVVDHSNATDGQIGVVTDKGQETPFTQPGNPISTIPDAVLSFEGLEPVDMTGSTIDRLVISLPEGVSNDASLMSTADGLELFSNSATFEHTSFAIPGAGQSVEIHLGDSGDRFDGTAADLGVKVIGGEGNDVILGGRGPDMFEGGDGDEYLQGGGGRDDLFGGPGNDTVRGQGSVDLVNGGPGIDQLDGGAGVSLLADVIDGLVTLKDSGYQAVGGTARGQFLSATISGGSGDDQLLADQFNGNVMLFGREGNDILRGGRGDDLADGGDGDDYLQGASGNDSLFGGNDNDTVRGQGGTDLVDGGDGVDFLDGGAGFSSLSDIIEGTVRLSNSGYITSAGQAFGSFRSAQLIGGPGADIFNAALFRGEVTLNGGDGPDLLTGGLGNDVLAGEEGNDSLNGMEGDDLLDGGAGNDTVRGDKGEDSIGGGTGDDIVDGGDGDSVLVETADADIAVTSGPGLSISVTGLGADTYLGRYVAVVLTGGNSGNVLDASGVNVATTLMGLEGDDEIIGGGLRDDIDGGDGNDFIQGRFGNDRIRGGAGNDLIVGDHGNDILLGGSGDDRLFGGADRDIVLGGDGNDLVSGNGRKDTLAGGDGVDQLIGSPAEIQEALGDVLERVFS